MLLRFLVLTLITSLFSGNVFSSGTYFSPPIKFAKAKKSEKLTSKDNSDKLSEVDECKKLKNSKDCIKKIENKKEESKIDE
jgi:hypothetical protein